MSRPRVLLVWGDDRRGFVEPFEKLSDRFDFVYLSRMAPSPDDVRATDAPAVYWIDHRSAGSLLDATKPSRIVFMSIRGGRDMALNVAARSRGIPTALLDHGLFSTVQQYRAEYRKLTQGASLREVVAASSAPGAGSLDALRFVARSLSWTNAPQVPLLGAHLALRNHEGGWTAIRFLRGEYRRPDRYISFSRRNVRIWREMYQAADAEIDFIGIPEFDHFFRAAPPARHVEPYDLLIDAPVADDITGMTSFSVDFVRERYLALAESCAREGVRLKVKLHPRSYHATWHPPHPSIDWLRETDIVSLLHGARYIYSYQSTLMLPAIVHKPVCIISILQQPSEVDDIVARGVALCTPLEDLGRTRVPFETIEMTGARRDAFVREYLHATDGRATERLGEALARLAPARRRRWPLTLSPRAASAAR